MLRLSTEIRTSPAATRAAGAADAGAQAGVTPSATVRASARPSTRRDAREYDMASSWRGGQLVAAKASATTSKASSSRSSEIDSGGRNRTTLPHVPHVSVTTPCWWQYADTAAVR